jgi:hypothetical protein
MVKSVQSQYLSHTYQPIKNTTHCHWQPQTFRTMKRSAFLFWFEVEYATEITHSRSKRKETRFCLNIKEINILSVISIF